MHPVTSGRVGGAVDEEDVGRTGASVAAGEACLRACSSADASRLRPHRLRTCRTPRKSGPATPRQSVSPRSSTRLDRLESLVEGLQDAMYRDAVRRGREIQDLEQKTRRTRCPARWPSTTDGTGSSGRGANGSELDLRSVSGEDELLTRRRRARQARGLDQGRRRVALSGLSPHGGARRRRHYRRLGSRHDKAAGAR